VERYDLEPIVTGLVVFYNASLWNVAERSVVKKSKGQFHCNLMFSAKQCQTWRNKCGSIRVLGNGNKL
jgi:hypothetical protein